MARVDCSHNIAHALIEVIDFDTVEVTLGGDVSGSAQLPIDPVTIQAWIKSQCGLTCFNFAFGFDQLKQEHKAWVEEHSKGAELQDTQKLDLGAFEARYERQKQDAFRERARWMDVDHDCAQSGRIYTLDMGESYSYQRVEITL